MRKRRVSLIAFISIASLSVGLVGAQPAGGDPVPRVVSSDPAYGLTESKPVKVGGGPDAEKAYLRSICGPGGERVKFKRLGSCCHFETPHGLAGTGLLDKYEIKYKGLKEPVILYLNMYDYEQPLAPMGFELAK